IVFLFFSSRRRHTRFSRDWSSDVCSSDLRDEAATASREMPCSLPLLLELRVKALVKHCDCCPAGSSEAVAAAPEPQPMTAVSPRSEERHVGKEGGSRGSPHRSVSDGS